MIYQILNATPPARSGLADYARKLQQHWPDTGVSWGALAPNVSPNGGDAWPGVSLTAFSPDADDLVRALRETSATRVILNYVPHGYDRNGAPDWLIAGLRTWKRSNSGRIFSIYHELFLAGNPWRRSSLYNRRSKDCFRRLAAITDGWVTSNERYFALACEAGADLDKGAIVPIGTNVEVRCARSPLTEPQINFRLVVFGLAPTRIRAMRAHFQFLHYMTKMGFFASLEIVGSTPTVKQRTETLELIPERLKWSTTERYDATEAEVSEALSRAQLGLCATEPALAHKSGVYAALCAHGVVPILSGRGASPEPLFIPNDDRDFTRTFQIMQDRARVAELQRRVLHWSNTVGSWDHIANTIHSGFDLMGRR